MVSREYMDAALALSPAAAKNAFGAAAAALGDLAKIFSSSNGPGSIQNDVQYFVLADTTASSFYKLATGKLSTALANIAAGASDVLGIVQGFEQGGVFGGANAGYAAAALAKLLGAASGTLLPIGIVLGLAALFLGGNHDNPQDMPDKYDTQRYGQGVANLIGSSKSNPFGANGWS